MTVKTYSTKASDIERQWHVIDANGQILGKVATQAARMLMGKDKPMFAPHLDTGDFVVVINASKIKVTGKKMQQKMYYRHSGYPGGFREVSLEETLKTHPTRAVEHAIKGMLPHTRLGTVMYRKLKVYAGNSHPPAAQFAGQAAKAAEVAKTDSKPSAS